MCILFSGESKTVEVLPKEPSALPLALEKEPAQEEKEQDTKIEKEEEEEEKVIVEVIKKKKFPQGKAAGLRIRSEPSLSAASVGLIKPGDVFSYTEEVSCVCNQHMIIV